MHKTRFCGAHILRETDVNTHSTVHNMYHNRIMQMFLVVAQRGKTCFLGEGLGKFEESMLVFRNNSKVGHVRVPGHMKNYYRDVSV